MLLRHRLRQARADSTAVRKGQRVSSSLRFLLALVGLAIIVAGGFYLSNAMRHPPSGAAAVDVARTKPSVKGLYIVGIEPEDGTVRQGDLQSWVLTLKSANGGAVEDAKIAVGGGMPEHNHGLPTSPTVTDALGGGRYRIDGVRFNMAGRWELRFSIDAAPGADEVTFNIVL